MHKSRIDLLKNRHAGERCVLVCNGPSLNKMDLSFLRNETCIALNKIFLGFSKFHFYPRYYVAVNAKVIEQSELEIRNLQCVKFLSARAIERNFVEDPLTYLINTQTPQSRFVKELSRGAHEGWTVTYVALQIAYFLGFSEVVIIGMDHKYQHEGEPNETRTLDGPDPNHFSDQYFGYGKRWDLPDLQRSEESFGIARTEFEQDGRRILDATVEGACQVFEKCDYRRIFSLS